MYQRWLLLTIGDNLGICLMILLRQAISADWCRSLSLRTRPPQYDAAESSMSNPWVLFWFGTRPVADELLPGLQRSPMDLWVVSGCLLHWKMANQHINDCFIESAKKIINPQVHYINWNRPHCGRQWLRWDEGSRGDKWKVGVWRHPRPMISHHNRTMLPFVYTDLVITREGGRDRGKCMGLRRKRRKRRGRDLSPLRKGNPEQTPVWCSVSAIDDWENGYLQPFWYSLFSKV